MEADSERDIKLGGLQGLVGYHLRLAGHHFATAMAATGGRQSLLGILSIIQANPGINQGAVGQALGIKRANMVNLVTELAEADLVLRGVSAVNRRAFSLTLSELGSQKLQEWLGRLRRYEDYMLANFSADERATLMELLGSDRVMRAIALPRFLSVAETLAFAALRFAFFDYDVDGTSGCSCCKL